MGESSPRSLVPLLQLLPLPLFRNCGEKARAAAAALLSLRSDLNEEYSPLRSLPPSLPPSLTHSFTAPLSFLSWRNASFIISIQSKPRGRRSLNYKIGQNDYCTDGGFYFRGALLAFLRIERTREFDLAELDCIVVVSVSSSLYVDILALAANHGHCLRLLSDSVLGLMQGRSRSKN